MKKQISITSLKKYLVFISFDFYSAVAAFIAAYITRSELFPENVVNTSDKADSQYPTAGTLIKENLPTGVKVTDRKSLIAFCAQWPNNPAATLLVMILTGKTRVNLKSWYTTFEAGFTGTSLLSQFWNALKSMVNTYSTALTNKAVLEYVNTAVEKTMNNNTLMVIVRETVESVTLTDIEMLAVKALLVQKYSATNQRVLIMFVSPTGAEVTSFLGNKEVENNLAKKVVTALTDVENSFKKATTPRWQDSSHVIYTTNEGTSIPTDQLTTVIETTVNNELEKLGEFTSSDVSTLKTA